MHSNAFIKGRPVSQCNHCRTLRKSRSAHVRCDCGEKSHTKGSCTHESDIQGELHTSWAPQQQLLTVNAADSCCCSHGGRCSCALKKDYLDPVLESDSDEASSSSVQGNDISRPRALTTQSEGGLTVFANGHHKPVHKHNNKAHTCGLPYVVPKAHSIHGPSPSCLANRSVDNLPHTSTIDALHSDSHIKDSIVSAQQEQRMVKSEHGSPLLSTISNLDQLNGQLPPLDLSNLPENFDFMQNADSYSNLPDLDQPLFSAGLSSDSIDWSHYDGLEFNNDNFASYSQAPSFTGFDFSGVDQPPLTTTSTSGEISEVEDMGNATPSRPGLLNVQYGSDFDTSDFGGEKEGYRLSSSVSSYIGMPQTQMLESNSVEGIDMDAFLNNGYLHGHDGLPASSYLGSGKPTQGQYPDNSFPTLSTTDDNGLFWISDGSSNIAINPGYSEPPEENVWAQ